MTTRSRGTQIKVSLESLERAARIYRNNALAGKALGIAPSSFSRLCRQNNIMPPSGRK